MASFWLRPLRLTPALPDRFEWGKADRCALSHHELGWKVIATQSANITLMVVPEGQDTVLSRLLHACSLPC
jgi:hypothetical protein